MAGVGRPLEGVKVLELAQNLAGPYCGQILGDLGAAVIKVEPPSGDAARAWAPPYVGGSGSIFAAANRGKRSVALDLRQEDARAELRLLIEQCDILIEAFRPGAFAQLGFDYDTVQGWHPGVIYCSVLAYGEEGPLRELPGYDPLMQAHGGLMSVTGAPGSRGVRVGTSVVDMGTGMWLTIAVLAALRTRAAEGRGSRLSVALYDTTLAWNAYHLTACVDTGLVPRPAGAELPMIVPYGAFPASDGELMIGAANDGLFVRLCTALRCADALSDARFRDNTSRVRHRAEIHDIISAATRTYATSDLLSLLRAAGVPCAPIQDMAEVAADPQTLASGMLLTSDGVTAMPLPIRWAGARGATAFTTPNVGEHSREVLAGLRR